MTVIDGTAVATSQADSTTPYVYLNDCAPSTDVPGPLEYKLAANIVCICHCCTTADVSAQGDRFVKIGGDFLADEEEMFKAVEVTVTHFNPTEFRANLDAALIFPEVYGATNNEVPSTKKDMLAGLKAKVCQNSRQVCFMHTESVIQLSASGSNYKPACIYSLPQPEPLYYHIQA